GGGRGRHCNGAFRRQVRQGRGLGDHQLLLAALPLRRRPVRHRAVENQHRGQEEQQNQAGQEQQGLAVEPLDLGGTEIRGGRIEVRCNRSLLARLVRVGRRRHVHAFATATGRLTHRPVLLRRPTTSSPCLSTR